MTGTREIPWLRIAAEGAVLEQKGATVNINATKFFLLLLTWVTPFLFVGQPAASEDAKSELIEIEKTIAAAVVNLNFETMDRTYADEFVFYHSTGVIEGKDDWLRKLRNGEAVYTARIVDSLAVDFHGDTAITSGRIHLKTKSANPKRREFTVWYYRIYENRDGRWQMVSHRSLHEELGPLKEQ